MTPPTDGKKKGFLFDVRVLELADHRGEFCGKLLAGAGADVVKVEPPEGSPTREIGPFYQDSGQPEESLHFWHYNFGKRGVSLDVSKPEGQALLKEMAPKFDVLVETFPAGRMAGWGLGYDDLRKLNPALIVCSITDFGQDGPWRDRKASDLVHLALGGVMMNCGYDPEPSGHYDTPPVAPQMWHASHITCNQAYMSIVAALLWREQSGQGQHLDVSMHHAVNTCTEMDIPYMTYNRLPLLRQTGRHAATRITVNSQAMTKDGRYVWASTGIGMGLSDVIGMLKEEGAGAEVEDIETGRGTSTGADAQRVMDVTKRWVGQYKLEADLWKKGQEHKMHWVPIRKPEENLGDSHWRARKTFNEVHHEDIGKALTYPGAPWLAESCPWRTGPRAPHLGEHNAEVFAEAGINDAKLKELKTAKVI